MLVVDLIDPIDELHEECIRAAELVRARFILAHSKVRKWNIAPMPDGFGITTVRRR